MGGAKKRSLAQAEKLQQMQTKKEKGGEKGKTAKAKTTEKSQGDSGLPDVKSKEFIGELGKMKAVTPSSVASRFNMKLSTSKGVLEDLAGRGVLTLVAGSNRLRIYTVASS